MLTSDPDSAVKNMKRGTLRQAVGLSYALVFSCLNNRHLAEWRLFFCACQDYAGSTQEG